MGDNVACICEFARLLDEALEKATEDEIAKALGLLLVDCNGHIVDAIQDILRHRRGEA